MNEHQASQIVNLMKASVGGRAERDALDYYSARLPQLDYQTALSAATTGSSVWRRFPSWSEFFELYRAEQKSRGGGSEEREQRERDQEILRIRRKHEIPFWVKRFIASRFLYARFGKERDLRPFKEQQPYVDPSGEFMPDDAWIGEAHRVSDRDVWSSLGS
jgi:hypothetical protein